MEIVLLVIHMLLAVALIGIVLIQRSEGGALGIGGGGGGGGMGGFMTGRAAANLLTRATAILAALFFATSMGLAWMAGTTPRDTGSILDQPARTAPPAPDGAGDSTGSAPAAPTPPTPPSTPSVPQR